jgi:nucleoside-diphosphate-sugar epimerase
MISFRALPFATRLARGLAPHHILVTGGAGYIGSALLPRLLEAGHRVRVLDLLLFGTEPIGGLLNHPRLELIRADLRQVDRVVAAMANVDAVVHLGAIVGDPACALDEELTVEVNLIATRMVAEIAKGRGIRRFVFASSCSVYGASEELLTEDSVLNPVSLYARTKLASERVLNEMADHRFTPVSLRFATVYGLSGRTRFDLIVNTLAARAVADGEIPVFGGDQWRPFVHVDDVARAIYLTLHAPSDFWHGSQVFNVGSNEQNYTIEQVAEIVRRNVPTARLVNFESDGDRRNYRVDFTRVRQTLGFTPRLTVEDGVRQVVDALRTGRVKDYRDSAYSNVMQYRQLRAAGLIRQRSTWVREFLESNTVGPALPQPA